MSLTEELVLKRSKAESLECVRTLNCWGCSLSDVQLLSQLENLEVLNLSGNNMSTLKDLKQCTKLRELFIRRNKLTDFSELAHLEQLNNLKVVWLSGNPLSEDPCYRSKVVKMLPQITKLDNIDLRGDSESGVEGGGRVLEAVQLLLKELNQTQLETVRDTVTDMLK